MPLVSLKEGDRTPLTLTEKLTEETHFITKSHHLVGKLKANMMEWRKFHSTRSYALAISSLIAHAPVLPFLIRI
jgi:hypothetical protein